MDIDTPTSVEGTPLIDALRWLADRAVQAGELVDLSATVSVRTPGHPGNGHLPGWHLWYRRCCLPGFPADDAVRQTRPRHPEPALEAHAVAAASKATRRAHHTVNVSSWGTFASAGVLAVWARLA